MGHIPLEIKNLEKSFGTGFLNLRKVKPVKGISFEVKGGEIFGLLGPNGAGKTTTLKMITGLIFPDAGTISIFGKSSLSASSRKRIGFLPENPWFYEYLTAREFLKMTGGIFSIPSSEIRKRTDSLLERLGIAHAADTQMRKFSKGMLQRAGLAQAIINNPDFIILDEPLSGLDPIGRKDVRQLIIDLKKEGKTILFSSHILSDVEDVCDSVAILNSGLIKQKGRLSDLTATSVGTVEIQTQGPEMKLPDFPEKFRDSIQIESTSRGTRIIFTEEKVNKNEILSFLIDAGQNIDRVFKHNRSLEDIFMETSSEPKQREN